jgi:hypothetical protein
MREVSWRRWSRNARRWTRASFARRLLIWRARRILRFIILALSCGFKWWRRVISTPSVDLLPHLSLCANSEAAAQVPALQRLMKFCYGSRRGRKTKRSKFRPRSRLASNRCSPARVSKPVRVDTGEERARPKRSRRRPGLPLSRLLCRTMSTWQSGASGLKGTCAAVARRQINQLRSSPHAGVTRCAMLMAARLPYRAHRSTTNDH